MAQNNLRKDKKEVHSINSTPMMCIDPKNGIYVTLKYDYGPLLPIHIVKPTINAAMDCEMESCQQLMRIGQHLETQAKNAYTWKEHGMQFPIYHLPA